MALTPEGKVKRQVDKLLAKYDVMVWKPVPSGYGKSGLDYHCVIHGHSLWIETKEEGKWLTPRQCEAAADHHLHGGTTFIISNAEGLAALKLWLDRQFDVD